MCFMNLTVYVVVGNLFLFLVFIFWKNFMSAKYIFMFKIVTYVNLCFIYHAARHSCLLINDKWKDRSSRYWQTWIVSFILTKKLPSHSMVQGAFFKNFSLFSSFWTSLRFFYFFFFFFFFYFVLLCFMNLTVYVVVGNLFLFLVFIFLEEFYVCKIYFHVKDCHLCQFVFIYHAARHSCLLINDKWKDRSSRY